MISFDELKADLAGFEDAAAAVAHFITTLADQLHVSVLNGNLAEVKDVADALHENKEGIAAAVVPTVPAPVPEPLPVPPPEVTFANSGTVQPPPATYDTGETITNSGTVENVGTY